jgi:hypothetical protein
MNKPFIVDLHKNRIEFTDNRFYITEDGTYVPSVTTILECYPKDAHFFQWLKDVGDKADHIRDEAGKRGSVVHNLTERYDAGEEVTFLSANGFPEFKMLEWAMFERFVDFTNSHNPEILMMEQHFADSSLGFAGTVDRVIRLNGKNILMDIKTSNNLHNSYWLQLAAYKELLVASLDGPAIDEVGILWLNAKTRTTGKNGAIQGIGWQLVTKDVNDTVADWDAFYHTKCLYESLNKDVRPRNISYQLKHKRDEKRANPFL